MILDAILLTVWKIVSMQQRNLVIIPDMRIGEGDGVQISHMGYELWLSGKADYVVIEFENARTYDLKGESDYQTPSLRAP